MKKYLCIESANNNEIKEIEEFLEKRGVKYNTNIDLYHDFCEYEAMRRILSHKEASKLPKNIFDEVVEYTVDRFKTDNNILNKDYINNVIEEGYSEYKSKILNEFKGKIEEDGFLDNIDSNSLELVCHLGDDELDRERQFLFNYKGINIFLYDGGNGYWGLMTDEDLILKNTTYYYDTTRNTYDILLPNGKLNPSSLMCPRENITLELYEGKEVSLNFLIQEISNKLLTKEIENEYGFTPINGVYLSDKICNKILDDKFVVFKKNNKSFFSVNFKTPYRGLLSHEIEPCNEIVKITKMKFE